MAAVGIRPGRAPRVDFHAEIEPAEAMVLATAESPRRGLGTERQVVKSFPTLNWHPMPRLLRQVFYPAVWVRRAIPRL